MANKNGLTIKAGFEKALAMYKDLGDAEMVAFFEKRLEQASKKSTTERKPTSRQNENEEIKKGILASMVKGETYSIPEMLATFDCFPDGMTSQRVSALLSQLGNRGTKQVKRIEGKDRAYFTLA